MIPPGRPMDRETLEKAIAVVAAEPELPGDPPAAILAEVERDPVQALRAVVRATKRSITFALAQLRDAAPRTQVDRTAESSDLDDKAVAQPNPKSDAICQPEKVGGQTPTDPQQELTADMIHQMFSEAEAAYNRARSDAAGSGEGRRVQHEFGNFAKAETVRSYLFQAGIIPAPVGEQTPTDPDEETPLSAYNRGRLAVCTELTLAVEQFNDDDTKGGAGQLCEAIAPWLLNDSDVAAHPPPGAPAAFTPSEVTEAAQRLQLFGEGTFNYFPRTIAMLRAYAALLPTEGRKETR